METQHGRPLKAGRVGAGTGDCRDSDKTRVMARVGRVGACSRHMLTLRGKGV